MWKQTKPLLVVLSVALNLAFVGVWLVYAAASRTGLQENAVRTEQQRYRVVPAPPRVERYVRAMGED